MKKIINIFILLFVLSNVFVMTSCSNENEVVDSEHQHIFTSTVVEATEKNDGYTSHECSECGYVYHDAFTTINYPLHTHVYTSTVVAPTTTHQGYTKHVCNKCAYEYHDTFVNVVAPTHTHKYTKTIVAPTCEKDGYTHNVCSCGDEYRDTFVDANGEVFVPAIDEKGNVFDVHPKTKEKIVGFKVPTWTIALMSWLKNLTSASRIFAMNLNKTTQFLRTST